MLEDTRRVLACLTEEDPESQVHSTDVIRRQLRKAERLGSAKYTLAQQKPIPNSRTFVGDPLLNRLRHLLHNNPKTSLQFLGVALLPVGFYGAHTPSHVEALATKHS